MKLYYRLNSENGTPNKTITKFVTDPKNIEVYRGISNRYMTNKTYTENTTNIITFNGARTPGNKLLDIPNLYNETVIIISKPYQYNFIQASANYIDPGSSSRTELDSIIYNVSASSGIFSKYTKILIKFNNVNETRIVKLY